MNRPLIQQFADYAATRSGPFETEDCKHCPMADFGHVLFPEADYVIAGERIIQVFGGKRYLGRRDFGPRFFSTFIEYCPSWEELTARLRRAVA